MSHNGHWSLIWVLLFIGSVLVTMTLTTVSVLIERRKHNRHNKQHKRQQKLIKDNPDHECTSDCKHEEDLHRHSPHRLSVVDAWIFPWFAMGIGLIVELLVGWSEINAINSLTYWHTAVLVQALFMIVFFIAVFVGWFNFVFAATQKNRIISYICFGYSSIFIWTMIFHWSQLR